MFLLLLPIIVLQLMIFGCSNEPVKNSTTDKKPNLESSSSNKKSTPIPNSTSEDHTNQLKEEEFFGLFNMEKEQILKKLGDKYEIVDAGVEASQEGYLYDEFDFVIIFNTNNRIQSIYCGKEFCIKGVNKTMSFSEIQSVLGSTEVIETWFGIPENKMYEINYEINNLIFTFLSPDYEGKDSMMFIIFNSRGIRETDKKQTELESSPFIDKDTINEEKDEKQQIPDEPGNTTGNISNDAYVAKKGEWIYYSIAPTIRNYRDVMLYKEKLDGTGRVKICDDAAIYINVVGDWIFYSNRSDSRNGNGGKIYKIRKDGTSRTKVNNKDSAYINIVNGWIYYTNLTDGGFRGNKRIYKMKVDGTSITKLNDDESSHVNVIGDWIYYLKWEYNDEGFSEAQIYKMKTDGTQRSKIIEEYTRFMFTDGEWIFYNNMNDEERLYKVYINDTNENIKLTDEKIKFINASGDRLIYIVYKSYYKSGDEYLCSMKFDGTDKKTFKLFECNGGINIIDDWIHFYELFAEEGERRAIKLDGSVVKDMWSKEIIWSGDTIWKAD